MFLAITPGFKIGAEKLRLECNSIKISTYILKNVSLFDYFAWLPRKMVRIGIIGGTL